MSPKELLIEICVKSLREKGLDDENHRNRLKTEIKEIDNQDEFKYFLELYHTSTRFPTNENNLLVAFLLGLCSDFDIKTEPKYLVGDWPDVDQDYLPLVRDYLKNTWAQEAFGADRVCAIGNYTTFGIKSSLIDMARVFDKDRQEILALTTKLGLKDEDGKDLTFDKALEEFPELKKYCDENPDVAQSAKNLVGRNRGMGMHAGGLIISSKSLDELVPLVRGKDGVAASAFVEGLHGTDLGPLGLVKFDLLVVDALHKIALACKAIKDRHGLKAICADSSNEDWSDTSYLNDPDALAMAARGELRCVFQFDSAGIRDLAKRCNVDSFDELVLLSSIYRPGPMGVGMHDAYIARKHGEEEYEIHNLLKPILGKTKGIIVFQEQLMQVLNKVGDIPLAHCEKARKAISKKKEKDFLVYKEAFLVNGQKNLGWTLDEVQRLWDQILTWAGYGFNKSHAVAYTYLTSRMLWLKAHHPLEFFWAVMKCEGKFEKIKDIKIEAQKYGVKINRVNLNKSRIEFAIVGEEIYMGLANIKGIGGEVAAAIVANQPYNSFEDFLVKYGTETTVLKPLIGLGIFGDDRAALHEYLEYYKSQIKKREDRLKRFNKSKEKTVQEMAFLLPDALPAQEFMDWLLDVYKDEDKKAFVSLVQSKGVNNIDQVFKVFSKYRKALESHATKVAEDVLVPLSEFKPTGELEAKYEKIYGDIIQVAEEIYYGFAWDHLLEYSPDYQGGMTFAAARDIGVDEPRYVECQIVAKPKKKISKKDTPYYVVDVEDANGEKQSITVWSDDYNRFKEEFEFWDGTKKGHCIQLKISPPSPGFKTYTMYSPPRMVKHKFIPKDKQFDDRLGVMRRPILNKGK
jgi:DNA polymerase III alpha subunit